MMKNKQIISDIWSLFDAGYIKHCENVIAQALRNFSIDSDEFEFEFDFKVCKPVAKWDNSLLVVNREYAKFELKTIIQVRCKPHHLGMSGFVTLDRNGNIKSASMNGGVREEYQREECFRIIEKWLKSNY